MAGKIRVAVLDDYQGVAAAPFAALGDDYEVTVFRDTLLPFNHPDTPESVRDELVKRLEPFTIISTMRERTPFPRALIERLPNLKLLLTTGGRNAALDLPAFKDAKVPVAGAIDGARTKGAGVDSTTEHTVTLILALARNVAGDDGDVKTGGWQRGFATSLSGKTLGVLGLGRLGTLVARILHIAFGMKVIAWSANLTQEGADAKAAEAGLPVTDADGDKTFRVVSREELFAAADVLSVHLVLSERSRGLITKDDLARMKKTAYFVNTSRGPLVVERDLLDVLKEGRIQGAALDVFDIEPLPSDSAWRDTQWGENGTSRVLLTPHMGYVDDVTIVNWYGEQVENIKRWKSGEELKVLLY